MTKFGLFTERREALYYYLVGLGETSLAQEVREKVAAKGKIYFPAKNTAITFLTQRVNLPKWPN